MRCLTLADVLRERGAECKFICRLNPGNLVHLIANRGFTVICLPIEEQTAGQNNLNTKLSASSMWLGTDWQTDANQVIAEIGTNTPDWLIVDHYCLDHRWEQMLRPHARRIMVIDDLADRKHDCDLLLDQNLVTNHRERYDSLLPDNCIRLLGPKYALLHNDYARLRNTQQPRNGPIRRIFVYFGGADNHNLTGACVDAILKLDQKDIEIEVVIHPESPHAETMRQRSKDFPRIHLHERLPSLANLMLRSDLAIGAGGSTSWERCCLGLPTLAITLSDNQRPIADSLCHHGCLEWLGHFDEINEKAIYDALQRMLVQGSYSEWSQRCRKLVDGNGTARVAEVLSLSTDTPLKPRLATGEDEELLLQLANDTLVRSNSFQQSAINAATHHQWLHKRLNDPDHHLIYLIESCSGFVAGLVRFERNGNQWEISFLLTPEARGKHLGKYLVKTGLQAFAAKNTNTMIFGRVKPGNIPSQRIFHSLGFSGSQNEECITYILKL